MKNSLFFLLLCCCFVACTDDEATPDLTNRLNYDGANLSAPNLPTGRYEAVVRFTANETAEFAGRKLEAVEVYFTNVGLTTEIVVYGPGENDRPGPALYTADVGSSLNTDSWNTHTLSVPIDITEDELWIAVRIDHPITLGTVGCDQGPADANGDILYVNADNTWTDLRAYTNGQTNINWNIRGVVSE